MSQPGIVFGLNDSRHQPLLFAFDSAGSPRGVWTVQGARNVDWEAAALGPCGPAAQARSCLYIGDVGDNAATRSAVTIYRVPEPVVGDLPAGSSLRSELLHVRYADHAHDVEAMYVVPDGAIFLITKRRLLDSARRPRPALVYRVPPSWGSSGTVTARLVDSLPIVPGTAPGRQVTDAALSPDGRLLAVRTYSEVYIFAMDTATGLPVSGAAPTSCIVLGLENQQGEGVGWWWDGKRLLLTSEGVGSPLFVVECSLPAS